jgi:hypothetical protein
MSDADERHIALVLVNRFGLCIRFYIALEFLHDDILLRPSAEHLFIRRVEIHGFRLTKRVESDGIIILVEMS